MNNIQRLAAAALGTDEGRAAQAAARLRELLDDPGLNDRSLERVATALGRRGDQSALPALLTRLTDAPPQALFSLHDALIRITGWDPVIDLDPPDWPDAVRRAWVGWNPAGQPAPQVSQLRFHPEGHAQFELAGGTGRIAFDFDPPVPGSTWIRWGRSLMVGDSAVYGVGSTCGTCEAGLNLVGWPAQRAAVLSDRLRRELADPTGLTSDLIDAATPLLAGLRSGHYLADLAEFDLCRVTEPAQSWFWRRLALRGEEQTESRQPENEWPGTQHFQLREQVSLDGVWTTADESRLRTQDEHAGPPRTFVVVMPTQPLTQADPATVDAHANAIAAGSRPAAVMLGWIDERDVEMDHPERFLIGVVLDGHHKLLAYARLGIPARILLVCRIEDTWGPPGDRGRFMVQTLTAIAQAGRRD